MKVGFTGTREGMTSEQYSEFALIISNLIKSITEFHHGDCIGSDREAHECVLKTASFLGDAFVIMCLHPGPDDSPYRAWCTSGMINQAHPKSYLDRNHDIVEAVDFMIACPEQFNEKLRSGTWSTIRYSRVRGVKLSIIYPDGSREGEIKRG